jgi:hypothetical protein
MAPPEDDAEAETTGAALVAAAVDVTVAGMEVVAPATLLALM